MHTRLALAASFLVAGAAHATIGSLPPAPPFPWGAFVPGSAAGAVQAVHYVDAAGATGAAVTQLDVAPLVVDPVAGDHNTVGCNGAQRCFTAGTLSMQYVAWQGVQRSFSINRAGATLLAGFTPSAREPAGMQFSFLQIYTDAYVPGGTVDSGNAYGKVNGQIPWWNPSPQYAARGWNYNVGGVVAPWDYLDIPLNFVGTDPVGPVSFETALVGFMPGSTQVDILADFRWGYTTQASGPVVIAQPLTMASGVSSLMLSLYDQTFPGYAYDYVGGVLSAPEPGAWALMGLGVGILGGALRRRRRAAIGA